MPGPVMTAVRRFLATRQRPTAAYPEVIRELRRIAERSARRTGLGRSFEVMDLVNELLLDAHAGGLCRVDWLGLGDAAARGLISRRVRQLAVEMSDHWGVYRGVSALVGAAKKRGLPAPPAVMPGTIFKHGRLHADSVAAAAARLEADGEGRGGSVRRLSSAIVSHYLPSHVSMDAMPIERMELIATQTLTEELIDSLDADRLLRDLLAEDPDGARLLERRLRGESLSRIARDHGVGVTTVHTRERAAKSRLRTIARTRGYSIGAVRRHPVDH